MFPFELFAAVLALWCLGGAPSGSSAVPFADNDSAVQAISKGGPNHSLTHHLVGASWFLADRESPSIWPERVGSSGNPADAPSSGRPPRVSISSVRPLPPL